MNTLFGTKILTITKYKSVLLPMKCMRLLIVFLLVFSWSNSALSQDLKGKLRSTTGEPIISGYLICSAKNIHTHSDINGNFLFRDIKVGDTLEISHIGYAGYAQILVQSDFESPLDIVIEEDYFQLDHVSISNEMRTANEVANIDLNINPVTSSQQVLRSVPGLFIGQHAGGGKAEQIFLRGFDIDHGTDITLSVDGMPVNMVSHAHGQGYADLHFVIPETIEKIDFGKGTYYADKGNFNTAGYVDFQTKDRVKESSVGIEYGQFNTIRMFGIMNLLDQEVSKNSAYIATEYLLTDGPFESEQNFNRLNMMGKYIANFDNDDKLSVQFSRFQSKWDASGQVPQRTVDNGSISRFGAIDNTEGGNTSRTNIALQYTKNLTSTSFLTMRSYYVDYDFELFSNFTFFLNDPVHGDQIRQKESRKIYGVESKLFRSFTYSNFTIESTAGIGMRYDDIDDNQLSFTTNREMLRQRLAYGNVDESNLYSFANVEFDFGNWLINPSVRIDHFEFNYIDRLQSTYETQSEKSTIVSPKLNIIYSPNRNLQLFVKSGFGFHSNDTRVVVAQSGVKTLPRAFGTDVGAIWKPFKRLWLSSALWQLYLEQEFVYVGDEAIVEPSGRTQRRGVELGVRLQLTDDLFFDSDATYTFARSIDTEINNYIPLAPIVTTTGGLSYKSRTGLKGAVRYRYIMDRPANEDNSIVANGYLIFDANLSYRFNNLSLGFSIENLLDSEWNEAQFATESRLKSENDSVEELHFTPGTPLSLKGKIMYSF